MAVHITAVLSDEVTTVRIFFLIRLLSKPIRRLFSSLIECALKYVYDTIKFDSIIALSNRKSLS